MAIDCKVTEAQRSDVDGLEPVLVRVGDKIFEGRVRRPAPMRTSLGVTIGEVLVGGLVDGLISR